MANENNIDLEYYDLHGGTHHIFMAPGNVRLNCNILYNYEQLMQEFLNNPPEENSNIWKMQTEYYLERVHKIRQQLEESIGYSTEKHWEKCLKAMEKKRSENQDGIGEEALLWTVRKKAEEERIKQQKKEKSKQN